MPKIIVLSTFIAGIVFNTYKASVNSISNTVRAIQAQKDRATPLVITICLYLATANPTSSQNFCLRKELNSSVVSLLVAKRALRACFSLKSTQDNLCYIINIPILYISNSQIQGFLDQTTSRYNILDSYTKFYISLDIKFTKSIHYSLQPTPPKLGLGRPVYIQRELLIAFLLLPSSLLSLESYIIYKSINLYSLIQVFRYRLL